MKIIEPKVEYIQQMQLLPKYDMFKHIEKCARTCYKSEDKITKDSAEGFVKRMINSKHFAMLEHGTVYLYLEINPDNAASQFYYHDIDFMTHYNWSDVVQYICTKYSNNPYSKITIFNKDNSKECYITTNYRVIIENKWEDDMQFICAYNDKGHIPRITLKFITNIGVTREGNRMRANSIAEESTRYCNYTKEKFGNELNIVLPAWIDNFVDRLTLQERTTEEWISYINSICINELSVNTSNDIQPLDYYGAAIAFCNICYNNLIREGWKAQQAREVLPLATKSEVVYTAYPDQWKHFFDLRLFGTTGAPHPNMKEIAEKAKTILKKEGLWNLIV